MEIKEKIKLIREHFKLNKGQFAESLGVHQTTISNVELGKTFPSGEVLYNIRKVYGVDPDYLLDDNCEDMFGSSIQATSEPKATYKRSHPDVGNDYFKGIIDYLKEQNIYLSMQNGKLLEQLAKP
ncbi:MAG: helix-turn-helix domain-containing protein [Thermonemataceae bacterium]